MDRARALAEHKLERLARTARDTVSFWRDATGVIAEVVPFDFHPCWFTVDPASLIVTGHFNEGLDGTPPEIAHAWYVEEDFNSPAGLAAGGGGAATVTSATGGDRPSSWRWRNLLEPLGFDDSLDAVLSDGGAVWGALSLLRRSGSRPFGDDEVRYVRRVGGTLGAGTRLGLLRAEAAEAPASDAPAVLIVSADLVAGVATENAAGWLADLADAGGHRPDRLPLPVQAVALRALRAPGGEGTAVVRAASGRWARVHGSRLAGGHEAAVVVAPATPADVAPVRLAGYGLTPREREVVELVLAGRSTREIAGELFISEYTVQDRLKAIFEKVGVRSRRELVAAVYASDFAPRVAANDARARAGLPIRR